MPLREAILSALYANLKALDARVLRNVPLPEQIGREGVVILQDNELRDSFITSPPCDNPCSYKVEIQAAVEAPEGRDAAFNWLLGSLRAVIGADRTLGGLCDWIKAEAAKPVNLPFQGASNLKVAVIPVSLHSSSLILNNANRPLR